MEYEVKIASEGKVLATLLDDDIIITDRVQAPKGTDISMWLEFDSEEDAKNYYGISTTEDYKNQLKRLGVDINA